MPVTIWPSTIASPKDGEQVNEQNSGRSIQQLSDRTDYLKQRLEEYSLKNGRVVIHSTALEPSVNVGDCVYYNYSSKAYGQAIAEGAVNEDTGLYEASNRAFAVGICISKNNPSLGDILVSGFSDLNEDFAINPRSLFDYPSSYRPEGTRGYLSSVSPGKLTSKPNSPLVQVGMFSDEISQVVCLQKDIFESHLHYKFRVSHLPGSSQNFSGTGIRTIDGDVFIDYCSNEGEEGQMPSLLLSFKKNHSETIFSESNPVRIEIRKQTSPSSKMLVSLYSGAGLDREDNTSGATIQNLSPMDWPEYGEYIEIPTTGVSVAFFRWDGVYADSLSNQLAANNDLISTTDRFKIFAPQDLYGWTNANPFEAPVGTRYKLGHESIENLNAVWPPTPVDSVLIESNGIHRVRGAEYVANRDGVFWNASAVPPWFWDGTLSPYDYTFGITPLPGSLDFTEINENVVTYLYFSKTSLENSRSVVLSLGSESPMISVKDCFTGEASTSGHLKLGLDLSLNEEASITDGLFTTLARVNPSTNRFVRSPVVTELVPGPGIKITKTINTGSLNKNCGRLEVSASNLKFEGVVEIVSLINAKEDFINEIVPCVYFIPVSNGRSRMVSRIRVPSEDLDGFSDISLVLSPMVFGEKTVGATQENAKFSVSSFVVGAGTQLGALSLASPGYTSNLSVVFANYSPMTLISEDPITISGLAPGNQIYTVWERVAADSNEYDDNVGFTQISWKINTTL
jgi:hypothetical protein